MLPSLVEWETGQAVGFRDWCPGQPNITANSGQRTVITGSMDYCWRDTMDTESHGYICEMPGYGKCRFIYLENVRIPVFLQVRIKYEFPVFFLVHSYKCNFLSCITLQ